MRLILQRTARASVIAEGQRTGEIGTGLLVLVGVEGADTEADADWLLNKVLNMRIFPDKEGKMNLSVKDADGGLLIVSQFTLHASTRKGNRPSFIRAAAPGHAEKLYNHFVAQARHSGLEVGTGIFGAHMDIDFVNDGPVTIFIDSKMKE